jgi:hypothetical protein
MEKRTFVSQLEDIPRVESWVILQNLAVYHEGDERSRQAPGHGYPAHTDNYVTVVEVFTDEVAFMSTLAREVREQHQFGGREVRGFKLTPYTAKTIIEVEVTDGKK